MVASFRSNGSLAHCVYGRVVHQGTEQASKTHVISTVPRSESRANLASGFIAGLAQKAFHEVCAANFGAYPAIFAGVGRGLVLGKAGLPRDRGRILLALKQRVISWKML
jgi:hypothetical protein